MGGVFPTIALGLAVSSKLNAAPLAIMLPAAFAARFSLGDRDRLRAAEANAYAGRVLRGDFGLSLRNSLPVGTLLASGREVILVHKDMEYRLRLTSNDKLILTK